jgi:hypothetical protein
MDHMIPHNLHPSCHHRRRPGGRSAILHTMTFLWSRMVMTSTSIPPLRWRRTSPSTIESLFTLMSTRWTYLRGLVWTKSFPRHPDHWLGKTLQRATWWNGPNDSSDRWMTFHTCKWRCRPPSTHRPAWRKTSSVTLGLSLMLKSGQDLSLGEVPGAQVWVIACLISFPLFPVIPSIVLPVGHITTIAMVASKYCFH